MLSNVTAGLTAAHGLPTLFLGQCEHATSEPDIKEMVHAHRQARTLVDLCPNYHWRKSGLKYKMNSTEHVDTKSLTSFYFSLFYLWTEHVSRRPVPFRVPAKTTHLLCVASLVNYYFLAYSVTVVLMSCISSFRLFRYCSTCMVVCVCLCAHTCMQVYNN